MKKNQVDIIVDASGRLVATSPAGASYQMEPVTGQKKHRIELPEHIANKNASEYHSVISQLLYFENDVAKIKELHKTK